MFKTPATLIAAAVAATGAFALPAAAASAREAASIAVAHGDLDLTSQDGQDALQRRMNRAASQVCRVATNPALLTAQDEADCFRSTRRTVAVQFAEVMADRQVARGG